MTTTLATPDTLSSEILPDGLPVSLVEALAAGSVVPYLGPRVLALAPDYAVPATPEALVALLTAKSSVPHKIRNRLTQSAQYIENFKHRKTLVGLMNEAFAAPPKPAPLHESLAGFGFPLIVDAWYDDAMAAALAAHAPTGSWGQVQGWPSPSTSAPGPAGTTPRARPYPTAARTGRPSSTSPSGPMARRATTWCRTPTTSKC
jgi:hypothetical protein